MKIKQIFYRIIKKLKKVKTSKYTSEIAIKDGGWETIALGKQRIYSNKLCKFLNVESNTDLVEVWNNANFEKLWLYNLHYFDDLNAEGAGSRQLIHDYWLKSWINDNPTGVGNGWEPYPLSLRIVNWIKYGLSFESHNQMHIKSLGIQADYLANDLEYHLLGNHLFVNAKALVFAGLYLQHPKSEKWLNLGTKILLKELDEQIFEEGANFELTPMYHAIILTDLLDLKNLSNAYKNRFPLKLAEKISAKIPKMLRFLYDISHMDDRISFFNDSAFGIAPENSSIYDYAKSMGFKLEIDSFVNKGLIDYEQSGFIIYKTDHISLICDLNEVGPSYIPGHAHADTLSFELCISKQRFFVNSGTSEYGLSKERLRQRGTAAHNTVAIDKSNSTEIWSGFRVARRAEIVQRKISEDKKSFFGIHNGYQKQGIDCLHKRNWDVTENDITITDSLVGNPVHIEAYFHLHPDIKIENISKRKLLLTAHGISCLFEAINAEIEIKNSTWHPEFGVSINSKCICLNPSATKFVSKIKWNPEDAYSISH
ncbi:heparinase II/III family protein [Glaciecola petra]|uniref:Alginate lyase family protein n=1 Tax=Glaciecola petra TaxID=3075602 RepID=A0ABU2ZPZ0_9ALTE|nr:alginate lyase family protein [Aestuariibacter sp. P117]MDT0593674.1 alginate lyase family protein [Aestuariibacter sp. P117]